jgi:hypothetical protein
VRTNNDGMPITGAGKSNVFRDLVLQRLADCPSAGMLDDADPYLAIVAEFLMAGYPAWASRWYRPDHDPAPGPEVTRLFDGTTYYERVDADTWREEGDPEPGQGMRMFFAWSGFAGKIVADATRPRVGSFKINNPSPGGPVADWQSASPGECQIMLEQAMDIMRERIAAGALDGFVATRWTPPDGGPILLIRLGDDLVTEHTVSHHDDQQ